MLPTLAVVGFTAGATDEMVWKERHGRVTGDTFGSPSKQKREGTDARKSGHKDWMTSSRGIYVLAIPQRCMKHFPAVFIAKRGLLAFCWCLFRALCRFPAFCSA